MKKLNLFVLTIIVSTISARAFAQDPLSQGKSLLDKKDYAGALPYLLKAVSTAPRSENANLYLGDAYLGIGNLDSARVFLAKAVEINDELAPAYYGLGQVLLQEKKYADAIKNLQQAISYDAKNSEYVITLGQVYLASDSLDLAMQAFYKAKDLNDKDPRAFEGIGDVYRRQSIFDPAIENYKSSIAIDSTSIPVMLKLANTYMQNSNGGEAFEEFSKISTLAPNNPDAQLQAGELLYINKHYKEAFAFLEKYHQLVPNNDKELAHLWESAFKSQLYPEAIKYSREYIAKYPNSVDAKKNLGAAFYFEKKYPDSYNIFKSLPVDSLTVTDLVRYGMSASAVHDTGTAVDALTRAVTKDTSLSAIENLLAGTLFAAKRYDEAITHFRKHLSMDSTDAGAWLNMGLCYFIVKDYPNAIASLRTMTNLKPDNTQGQLWLARTYLLSDSLQESEDAYETVIKIVKDDTSADNVQTITEAYRQIGYCELFKGAKLQKDRPEEAKRYYNVSLSNLLEALKHDSKDIKTHALLAQVYALLSKTDDSCKEVKYVLRASPKDEQMLKLQKSLSCE